MNKCFRTYPLLVVMFLCTACHIEPSPVLSDTVKVSFQLEERKSNSDGPSSSYDILVFRHDNGSLIYWGRTTESSPSMTVPSNVTVDYRIVANAPDIFSTVASRASYDTVKTILGNVTGAEEMTFGGCQSFNRTSYVEANLERLYSKIFLANIIPSFKVSSYPSAEVVVRRLFVINTPGNTTYSGEAFSDTLWLNPLALSEDLTLSQRALLVKEINKTITTDDTLTVNASLYCFPNSIDNGVTSDDTPQWSPRNSRIVLQIDIDGIANYYPITLGAMARNSQYTINNLAIIGPGASKPDRTVSRQTTINYDITVTPWVNEPIYLILE